MVVVVVVGGAPHFFGNTGCRGIPKTLCFRNACGYREGAWGGLGRGKAGAGIAT